MRSKCVDIPEKYYFEAKNVFSGSGNRGDFNFRLDPVKESGKLNLIIWYGKLAYNLSEIVFDESYEMSAEGYDQAVSRLDEEFEKYSAD